MVDVVGITHLMVDMVGQPVLLGTLPVQYYVAGVRHDDHVPAHVEPRVVRADPCQVYVACRPPETTTHRRLLSNSNDFIVSRIGNSRD